MKNYSLVWVISAYWTETLQSRSSMLRQINTNNKGHSGLDRMQGYTA